jgi:hypothetical protein
MKTSSSWVLLRQFINFTYWCILLICALAFLHQAYDIMAKFEKQSTIVSMNLYHLENNYLPAITICPFNVFKDVELYHEKGQNLENHVMNLSEILTHNFIEEKVKTGEILVHETFAPRMGRCFTLNFSKPVNGDIIEIPISLRNDSNYQVQGLTSGIYYLPDCILIFFLFRYTFMKLERKCGTSYSCTQPVCHQLI